MLVAPVMRVLRPIWFEASKPRLTSLWLVDGVLPQVGVGLLFGHPGCGKSFLALDIALHVASGRNWHGRDVEMGAVLYVAAEGGDGVLNRIEAFKQHYDPSTPAFGILNETVDLMNPRADVGPLIEALMLASTRYDCRPAMLIVDTLSKTFGDGKENTDDMRIYVANCERIACAAKIFVLLVHHRPKDIESRRPRGHSSLEAGVDTIILLEHSRRKARPQRALARVTKQKDGIEGDLMGFTLRPIVLGRDERNQPISSCIIEPSDHVNDGLSSDHRDLIELSGHTRTILELLKSALLNAGAAVLGDLASIPAKEFRSLAMEALMASGLSFGAAKRAYDRAIKKLTDAGLVNSDNNVLSLRLGHEGQSGQVEDTF